MSSAQGASVSISQRASYNAVRAIAPVIMGRYGATAEVIRDVGENFIVLANHSTRVDMWMLAHACKGHAHFVAAKDLLRRIPVPAWERLIDPILIPLGKGLPFGAVRDILHRAWDGGNIILFPEGRYTLDGQTSLFSRSTAKLVKKARCALVTYRTIGGYLQWPMWADNERRGPVQGSVAGIYSSDQLAKMSVDEVYEAIQQDLDVDAYKMQDASPKRYKAKGLAEGIERVFAICPSCGEYFSISSRGDNFECSTCELKGSYDEYGYINGTGFDFATVKEWMDWQKERFYGDEAMRHASGDALRMSHARLMDIGDIKVPKVVEQGFLKMTSSGIAISDMHIPFEKIIDMEIGYHAESLHLATGDSYYEISGDKLPVALVQYAYQRYGKKA